jgi:uncharacterized protein GlcG (DUF336 family)
MRVTDPLAPMAVRITSIGGCLLFLGIAGCSDDNNSITSPPTFTPAPVVTHDQLKTALERAVGDPIPTGNGGLNLNMWATVVDTAGIVVAVAYTGDKEGDQWQGSRLISAQKANTAKNFSLDAAYTGFTGLALSTANLYSATQPGGSLFGLQESNPMNEDVAFGGDLANYGTASDYMVGRRIGGTNVFGGGFALYDAGGNLVGAVGVSGDTSCADHAIGWKTRFYLNLDLVPGGVASDGSDNIIYDIDGSGTSAGGFGHPHCTVDAAAAAAESSVAADLPVSFPLGAAPAP